jgi:AcrR family transcriptional regulator
VTSGTRTPQADRGARRRAQTRAQLLDAARTVFARQGVDATRINEITDEADVGFGSFYNHFASKDEILAAVVEDTARSHATALDELSADLDDPAEVVAVAHRHFVDLAHEQPELAWFMVRLEVTHDSLLATLGAYAARDLQLGIDAGRFDVPDAPTALAAMGGALLGTIRSVLAGRLGPEAGEAHVIGVLRMLGLDRVDATEVARRR